MLTVVLHKVARLHNHHAHGGFVPLFVVREHTIELQIPAQHAARGLTAMEGQNNWAEMPDFLYTKFRELCEITLDWTGIYDVVACAGSGTEGASLPPPSEAPLAHAMLFRLNPS